MTRESCRDRQTLCYLTVFVDIIGNDARTGPSKTTVESIGKTTAAPAPFRPFPLPIGER